jgi:cytoskeleton protein RodZ
MATILSDRSGSGPSSPARTDENETAGLGQLLRRARERRGVTLEQISNETKIPQRHLEALEHDNLAAVPGGFYRRAEIRVYARAVNLDPNLVLAELARTGERPAAEKAVPEAPGSHAPTRPSKRILIVMGVGVAAVLFVLATGEREPALDRGARGGRAAVSPQPGVPPVPATPDPVVTTPPTTQLDPVAPPLDPVAPPSASLGGAPAVATKGSGTLPSAASTTDRGTTEQATARASADSITELVVSTDPPGARVLVNGIGWGSAPITIRYLPPGNKRIRVSKDGYATEERVVRLAEGQLKMLEIRLRSLP